MKILVVCQYYYPEPFRITDICEELVSRGHEVTVVTGVPNYPMGMIYKGYNRRNRRNEIINGVRVHRCFTIGRRTGAIWRLFNYYSYATSSSRYTAGLSESYDIVFVNQLSPIMMANAGIAYKKSHNIKLVLYCLDLWPESLVVNGIQKSSYLYKLYHLISANVYRQADKILITSSSFAEYFKTEFGICDTDYIPQYAETLFNAELCIKAPNANIDLMFAGNVGAAQSVDTIIRAANHLRNIDNLHWHIVGDGSELEHCIELAESLKIESIKFHGRQPIEKMPEYYAMADAMIITMKQDEFLSKTLPSKVQTYMSAGKPIIGAVNGETAAVITAAQCG